jgi:hypothetical protein
MLIVRLTLARFCRWRARYKMAGAEWWADLADRLEGREPPCKPPVRGIGA